MKFFRFVQLTEPCKVRGWVLMGPVPQASTAKGLQQMAEDGTWETCSTEVYMWSSNPRLSSTQWWVMGTFGASFIDSDINSGWDEWHSKKLLFTTTAYYKLLFNTVRKENQAVISGLCLHSFTHVHLCWVWGISTRLPSRCCGLILENTSGRQAFLGLLFTSREIMEVAGRGLEWLERVRRSSCNKKEIQNKSLQESYTE